MTDFLLEILSEEIPARMQKGARADLERLFVAQLDEAGLKADGITIWSTPRRLALIARGLPDATQAVREEAKGPPTSAPDQAVEGFCRKQGISRDQLEVRDVKGRPTYFAVIDRPGRATRDVLAEAIPAIIRAFPWPKSQRWGEASLSSESLRWVRPLQGIVAIFGEELVKCEVGDVPSGYDTVGHRFHHEGAITIGSADDYQEKLRACHVIVDHAEREDLIREGAAKAAAHAGLELIADEGLVAENAGLTEWPVPLLGRFDEAFLDVPPEVIQLTARVNQKYFVCQNGDGGLANAFVCVANLDASDGGKAIVAGNERVLAARLSDAKFFWELDQKKTLAEHATGLARITFHEKLGTVADKVERVAKLAEWLATEGIVPDCDPQLSRQAAELCKADLVTEMVGEFPELQGLMGGYYAEKEGLDPQVAAAIRDHYKPVGQGDEVPTAPVTVAISLADKLDTIAVFFGIDERPTGSKDPFALRRAALSILAIIQQQKLRLKLGNLFAYLITGADNPFFQVESFQTEIKALNEAAKQAEGPLGTKALLLRMADILARGQNAAQGWRRIKQVRDDLLDFFADRLKVQQREAGVRHDLIDAVFALGGEDDLVRLLARVKALQSFVETEDGTNLLAGYKRAANILKKEDFDLDAVAIPQTGEEDPLALVDDPDLGKAISQAASGTHAFAYTPEPAEADLIAALDAAEPRADAAVADERFEDAMAALASLRGPIDAFFDNVTVNDDDPAKRDARLNLLARIRAAVHKVADFSKIEG